MRRKQIAFATPLLIGGAALIAFEAARRVFRMTQLFCPTDEPLLTWKPEDYGIPPAQAEEVWFEADDGALLYGWYLRANNPIASAVYCHGNTGNLTNPAFVMPHLLESGFNVLVFDYRGFGLSDGVATLGGVVSDTIAAARFHDTVRPKHLPSLLYGFSLGGAIAAQAIHKHPFDGLILQSTFTSLPDITRVSFPRLPLHLISGRLFDTITAVQDLDVPLLIIHGTDDETCPSWMAESIYNACGSAPKQIRLIEGGLHKDLWIKKPDEMLHLIREFAAGLPRRPRLIENRVPLHDRMIDSAFRYVRRHLREAINPS